MLHADHDYLVDYLPSILLTGVGVACCLPQLSSVVAQSLPSTRLGVGGGSLQAVRQLGGTFGVAITIAMLAGSADPLIAFDRVWWVIVAGGVATSMFALPVRTAAMATPATAGTR
jgi:hypothetical protein